MFFLVEIKLNIKEQDFAYLQLDLVLGAIQFETGPIYSKSPIQFDQPHRGECWYVIKESRTNVVGA